MSTHAQPTRPRTRRPAVIERRQSRREHRGSTAPRRAESLQPLAPAVVVAQAVTRRWVTLLGIPFVLAVVFFSAAISSGQEWLMGPAVVLGPTLLILAYIYLMLSDDTNKTR